jgi:hypothetical protein
VTHFVSPSRTQGTVQNICASFRRTSCTFPTFRPCILHTSPPGFRGNMTKCSLATSYPA